jgi:plastocyanin
MKKIVISLLLVSLGTAVFCSTWTITNSGFTFNPASITINVGDDVSFVLESMHNAVEVSQTTWNSNGNTPLSGGFSVTFGGGLVLPAQLTVGTHWYVCSPHASLGMKGIIIVNTATGINENQSRINISVYPNPACDFITVKTNFDLSGSPYFITDQAGRQVLSGKLNSEVTFIKISQFKKGIYLLQVAEQKKRSFKVIKN